MNIFATRFLVLNIVTLLLIGFVPLLVIAQERVESTTVETEKEMMETNYNNTRSNRSTVVGPDTNVCDGVTCADGSCAATPDECSTHPEAVEAVRDNGDDQSVDDDITTERAQNHNSSRSNRTDGITAPDFNDLDDDGDGVSTAHGRELDKASPKLFESLLNNDDNGTNRVGDLDDDGRPDVVASVNAFIKIDDIKGEVRENPDTGERHLSQVAVAARDLRNWTNEDREAFSRLLGAVASNTPEHASLRITERVLKNDRFESIEVSESETKLRYRTTMRLFGFIPLEREIEARAQAEGEIEIDYPWYRFLSSNSEGNTIRNLIQSVRTDFANSTDRD